MNKEMIVEQLLKSAAHLITFELDPTELRTLELFSINEAKVCSLSAEPFWKGVTSIVTNNQ